MTVKLHYLQVFESSRKMNKLPRSGKNFEGAGSGIENWQNVGVFSRKSSNFKKNIGKGSQI